MGLHQTKKKSPYINTNNRCRRQLMNWGRIPNHYLSDSNLSGSTIATTINKDLRRRVSKTTIWPGVVVHTCAPSTKEPKGESLTLFSSIYHILGYPGMHSKTQFHKAKRRKKRDISMTNRQVKIIRITYQENTN